MKLIYKGEVIKESENREELERAKKLYVREEMKKYAELTKRLFAIDEKRAYVLPRNPKDTDEEYMNKVNMVNGDFVEEFENLLNDIPLEVKKIKYVDISKGNIRIVTDGETFTFGELNGLIGIMSPVLSDLKIV